MKKAISPMPRVLLWSFAVFVILSDGPSARAGPLDADFDVRVHSMCLETEIPSNNVPPSWEANIPRQIHQIWFGPLNHVPSSHLEEWQTYADLFGYHYRLWTDEDVPFLMSLVGKSLYDKFVFLLRRRELRGASDIARYALLNEIGGIYVDADMPPPSLGGNFVDLQAIAPLKGMIITTDGEAVDLGVGGIHALNGLLMSSPHHPTLESLLSQLAGNIECCARAQEFSPVMMTGPAVLNIALNQPVTLVPMVFWDLLGLPDSTWR